MTLETFEMFSKKEGKGEKITQMTINFDYYYSMLVINAYHFY